MSSPHRRPQRQHLLRLQIRKGAHVGFIASESQSFCGQCSRLRLSAEGELTTMSFKNEGISLRDLEGEASNPVIQSKLPV